MNYSVREFDTTGMLIAKMQADIFSNATKKELGSYYFLRRFASSDYCKELDSLAILKSSLTPDNFWFENEETISKKGTILPSDVMHWIGYIYRFWCYTESISLMKLIKDVPIIYMSMIYNAYHSLSPEEVVSHVKEMLHLNVEEKQSKVIEKFRKIYIKRSHEILANAK